MRNKHLLLAMAVLFLPPALALAATLDQLTATADCNAWASEVTIAFRPDATDVLLAFTMQLADSTGVEIERFYFEEWLPIPTTASAVYPFGAAWLAPLDRAATMTVSADVYDARGDRYSLTSDEQIVALDCSPAGGGGGSVCRHAARWWLRHRAEWPMATMNLGHVEYDTPQIADLLRGPHRGLVGRRLAHQLAVTKLNLANGAVGEIAAAVVAADAWLVARPLASRELQLDMRPIERREALRLIKELHRWNHGGCPDGSQLNGDDDEETNKDGLSFDFGGANQEFTGDLADYDLTGKAAEEVTNLGTLKAMFR